MRLRRDVRRTRNWPTAPGKILERGIEPMQTSGRLFSPKIKYAYLAGGEEYVGERVYLTGRVGWMPSTAQRVVNAMPDPIPVFYNPQDPAEAYVLKVSPAYFWVSLIMGTGVILWVLLDLFILVL